MASRSTVCGVSTHQKWTQSRVKGVVCLLGKLTEPPKSPLAMLGCSTRLDKVTNLYPSSYNHRSPFWLAWLKNRGPWLTHTSIIYKAHLFSKSSWTSNCSCRPFQWRTSLVAQSTQDVGLHAHKLEGPGLLSANRLPGPSMFQEGHRLRRTKVSRRVLGATCCLARPFSTGSGCR